jgi:hypothetical protein
VRASNVLQRRRGVSGKKALISLMRRLAPGPTCPSGAVICSPFSCAVVCRGVFADLAARGLCWFVFFFLPIPLQNELRSLYLLQFSVMQPRQILRIVTIGFRLLIAGRCFTRIVCGVNL